METQDDRFMRMALAQAARGRGMTSPNPMVGAVLVKQGQIIGKDYHRRAGTPHAEALVLQQAGSRARGATLYVNLEPCCHKEKRTPPCTSEILRAGIRRIVVGMEDPNPKVSGRGLAHLKEAGVSVIFGVLQDRARRLNEAYVKHITTGLPFVILKIASTLDGKIATVSGESRWITGETARQEVHRMRGAADAVMVGSGTATALASPEKIRALKERGVEVLVQPGNSGKVDFQSLLDLLGERGINSILVEGGSELNAVLLREKIADKVVFFLAPKIIGGQDAVSAVGGVSPKSLADAVPLRDLRVRKVGEDLMVEGYVYRHH
ncbi:MAG: bifunctional diaminohydroxyphosphoribosylaminopyrimidine deaminase/5-amino-6-(5-phosphoribosylamino)uracil reductase RibD [Chitinivibrionia bacterium]|nr:bifunctional diaminohydroxyphosphoribosylaminopyrimidine deaminase/5-amino-6-(5-phosphoribosylamino)uracil reductase RibD [Chitinivibrionia bacterium]